MKMKIKYLQRYFHKQQTAVTVRGGGEEEERENEKEKIKFQHFLPPLCVVDTVWERETI